MRPRAWCCLSVLLTISLAPDAFGDDDVAAARTHFIEGVKRFEAGDIEGARAFFRRAESEHHAPVTLYNIARAEERLAHPQAAVDAYEAYLAESGDGAEFGISATLAIVQIKARSPRLRVETKPGGARVFVDGTAMSERSPSTALVTVGRHHVVVEGEGWRAEADVDATETAHVETVTLDAPNAPAARAAVPDPPPPMPPIATPPAPPAPDGFIYGLSLALVPYHFGRAAGQSVTTTGLAAGGTIDLGYALTERVELLARFAFAIGSEGVPFSSVLAGGPAVSVRVVRGLWLGAAFLGGQAASNENRVNFFSTDVVFSPMLEVSYAVLHRPYGQWIVSVLPAYFVASPADNSAFYVPITFGLRSF